MRKKHVILKFALVSIDFLASVKEKQAFMRIIFDFTNIKYKFLYMLQRLSSKGETTSERDGAAIEANDAAALTAMKVMGSILALIAMLWLTRKDPNEANGTTPYTHPHAATKEEIKTARDAAAWYNDHTPLHQRK